MFRRIALALSLALLTAVPACKGTENVVGNPDVSGGSTRTLASMLPLIKSSLTVTLAEQEFGFPDQRTLVPPIILTYNVVENSGKVSLKFPDLTGTIQEAYLTDKNGQTPLPIQP